MRITKKVREEAALLCDLAASATWHFDDRKTDALSLSGGYPYEHGPAYNNIDREYGGFSQTAKDLAIKAFSHVCSPKYGGKMSAWTRAVDAEAAQLLREGWSPQSP